MTIGKAKQHLRDLMKAYETASRSQTEAKKESRKANVNQKGMRGRYLMAQKNQKIQESMKIQVSLTCLVIVTRGESTALEALLIA